MNELGPAFTHVIVMFDKTHHFITSQENAHLARLNNGVRATFAGFTINTSAISQILTVSDFYTAYPDERPSQLREYVLPPEEVIPLDRQAERSEKALRGLLAGILVYGENHGSSDALQAMMKPKMDKYREFYGKPMVLTDEDRQRVISSMAELDGSKAPKIPCKPCLKDWRHPAHEANASVDTASQFERTGNKV